LTLPDEIVFYPEGQKTENFGNIRASFSNPNQRLLTLTQREQQNFDQTWPGSKMFDPDPSLLFIDLFQI